MKKTLTIAACMFLLASATVLADTVKVTSKTLFSDPEGGELEATEIFAFRGTREIVFEVAGKTCVLNGSALGSQNGCNYTIIVEPDGSFKGELRAGSSNCTQSDEVAASCRASCK